MPVGFERLPGGRGSERGKAVDQVSDAVGPEEKKRAPEPKEEHSLDQDRADAIERAALFVVGAGQGHGELDAGEREEELLREAEQDLRPLIEVKPKRLDEGLGHVVDRELGVVPCSPAQA